MVTLGIAFLKLLTSQKLKIKKKNVVIHCVGQFLGSTIISWAPPIFSPLAALAPRPLAGLAPDDWDPAASDAG